MKLPPVQLAVLERGPGPDFQSISIEQQARQGVISAAGGVAKSYQDAAASSQALSGKADFKRGLTDLHGRLDNPITNIKDLEGVDYNDADSYEGPDGETYVPTHTVAQGIWDTGIGKIKQTSGELAKLPGAKSELRAFTEQAIEVSGGKAAGQIDKITRDYYITEKTNAVNQAISSGDYEGAVENLFFLKKEGFISESTHSKMLADVRDTIDETIKAEEIQTYEGMLLKDAETPADVEELYVMEAHLRDKDKTSSLTNKERDRLADAAEKKADENKLSLYAREEKVKGQLVSNVSLAIDAKDPRVTEDTIQQLYDDDIISSTKMTTMKKSYRTAQKQYRDDLAIDAAIQSSLSAGIAIDPNNKKQRDAVNRYYDDAVQQGLASGDESAPWTEALNTMRSYHIVPEKVGGLMRGSNRADAPQLLNAAVLYNEAKRTAPTALKDINNGTDLVRTVAANLSLGMSGSDAAQTAIEWSQMDQVKRDAIKQVYKQTVKAEPGALKDLVSSSAQFDIPWSWFNPEVPLTMQTQFDMLTEQYVPTTGGNVAAAQQKAFGDIKAQWFLTDINGDSELMKYAPQGNEDIMKRAIRSDYGENSIIRSDSLTEIQMNEGVSASYHVTRSGETPEIETKSRKGSAAHGTEWRESFAKSAGLTAEQLGIQSQTDAQEYLDALYESGNVVDLGRWTYDAEAEAEKENKKAIAEAKESYTKRRQRQEQKEVNKAEWSVRNTAVERGLNPSEYLMSEEGQAMKTQRLEASRAAGGLF